MSKASYWMNYTIDRQFQNWSPGTLIARFLNDPETPGLKDYEIISVAIVEVTLNTIEILVRQRALT